MDRLETRRIRLRPISDKDIALLHKWRNEEHFMRFCANRRNLVGIEQFTAELKRDFERNRHMQLIVELKSRSIPIGTVFSYDLNLIDGFAFMTLYVEEQYRHGGYGAEAGIVFFCYLFSQLPLHKIYFEAFSYNAKSLSTLRSAGFKEEGLFREHRFYDGTRHDVIRFAAYRNSLTRMQRLLDRFCRNVPIYDEKK